MKRPNNRIWFLVFTAALLAAPVCYADKPDGGSVDASDLDIGLDDTPASTPDTEEPGLTLPVIPHDGGSDDGATPTPPPSSPDNEDPALTLPVPDKPSGGEEGDLELPPMPPPKPSGDLDLPLPDKMPEKRYENAYQVYIQEDMGVEGEIREGRAYVGASANHNVSGFVSLDARGDNVAGKGYLTATSNLHGQAIDDDGIERMQANGNNDQRLPLAARGKLQGDHMMRIDLKSPGGSVLVVTGHDDGKPIYAALPIDPVESIYFNVPLDGTWVTQEEFEGQISIMRAHVRYRIRIVPLNAPKRKETDPDYRGKEFPHKKGESWNAPPNDLADEMGLPAFPDWDSVIQEAKAQMPQARAEMAQAKREFEADLAAEEDPEARAQMQQLGGLLAQAEKGMDKAEEKIDES